jgi:hypothetical protein
MRFNLMRADWYALWCWGKPSSTWAGFELGWTILAKAIVQSSLVGTWNVKPKKTMQWLNERHPTQEYYIVSG